jgi:2-keto-4-pentenoate hydratase/2-oxohepta-3-ene-1,7-dioic acid hydratase in catechol pathway
VRIARVHVADQVRTAVVDGEAVRLLADNVRPLDLLTIAADARDRLVAARTEAEVELAGARLAAPIQPASFRDFITFEEHVEGFRDPVTPEWYEAPQFYFTNPHTVLGPDDPVPVPAGEQRLDYELEVAAVLGRGGSDLTPEQAHACIAGYTIFNDWSARDIQFREMRIGLGPAKGKDFANTIGPWIVTADELEPFRRDDRLHLDMRVSRNGEELGDDSLANMAWSFGEMVAYASRSARVAPGDVLGSGTCGAGCLAELWGRSGTTEPRPVIAGDVVSLAVEGIGTLTSRVVDGVPAVPLPAARRAARRPRARDAG